MDYYRMGLDPLVIPIVQFFNENGLKTIMSCQGHNRTNLSMFWVEFDKSVTAEDILHFMRNHLDWRGQFTSCGRFAKRVFGGYSVIDQTWQTTEYWCYFAATVEAANKDLSDWMTGNHWCGLKESRYTSWIEDLKLSGKLQSSSG